ncbi:MAG: ribosome biogenesis GTPase Der [Pseudomonadota bacterium]
MVQRPSIAIVGRPNVGKSTLFNRMTGKRTALVSDMPGLTRDRREGDAEIAGFDVAVIDTAGLEEAPRNSIPSRMREQSELAIDTADLVLFVIDARDGITGADSQFAIDVRRSGRPTVLLANKCEGRKGQDTLIEAFELGLGAPLPVSAEHGEGISELEDRVREELQGLGFAPKVTATPAPTSRRRLRRNADDLDEAQIAEHFGPDDDEGKADEREADGTPVRPIKLAIVGRPNAGKSTLVNALLGEDRMITGPEPGLTRDSIATPFTWAAGDATHEFELFDTAGLRRKSRISEVAEKLSASDAIRAIKFAEVVVLLLDAEKPLEHQDLTIADHVTQEGRALVIGVNKWDLITEKQKVLQSIRRMTGDRLSQVPNIPVVPVSALAERGLDALMGAVIKTYGTWNRRVPTADLNRWLVEALHRHAPPAVSGRRIKIRYMTQPSARPPTFVAFASQPDSLPKSYHRYLLNSLREAFDLPAVPIRLSFRKGKNPYA